MNDRNHKIIECLASDSNAGYIIRNVAELEWNLDLMLTRFFTAQERFEEFSEIILSKFSFSEKISILEKMKFPREFKSQFNAVKSLNKFRKLRNILAHNTFISDDDKKEIISDNELRSLLTNFPKSYNLESRNTKNRINRLIHHYLSSKTGRKK